MYLIVKYWIGLSLGSSRENFPPFLPFFKSITRTTIVTFLPFFVSLQRRQSSTKNLLRKQDTWLQVDQPCRPHKHNTTKHHSHGRREHQTARARCRWDSHLPFQGAEELPRGSSEAPSRPTRVDWQYGSPTRSWPNYCIQGAGSLTSPPLSYREHPARINRRPRPAGEAEGGVYIFPVISKYPVRAPPHVLFARRMKATRRRGKKEKEIVCKILSLRPP